MKRKFAILGLAALLVLTGCAKMDLAASIGDREIPLSELQAQVDSILEERTKVDTSQMQLAVGEDLARSQLSFIISNIVIDAIAADEEIKISNSDIEAYRIQVIQNIGGQEMLPSVLANAAIPSNSLTDVLRRDLIIQKISSAATSAGATDAQVNELIQGLVSKKAEDLKIEINPRYGTWDSANFAIVPTEPAGDAVTDK